MNAPDTLILPYRTNAQRGMKPDVLAEARLVLLGQSTSWTMDEALCLHPKGLEDAEYAPHIVPNELIAAIALIIHEATDKAEKPTLRLSSQAASDEYRAFFGDMHDSMLVERAITPEAFDEASPELQQEFLSLCLEEPIKGHLEELDGCFARLKHLMLHQASREEIKQELKAMDRFYPYEEQQETGRLEAKLMKIALDESLMLAGELYRTCEYWQEKGFNIMRWHNSHPEAVNFVKLYPELRALEYDAASGKQIEDIPAFAASYWPLVCPDLELHATPQALEEARQFCRDKHKLKRMEAAPEVQTNVTLQEAAAGLPPF